ncbi:LamG-like jellyroll fold domain-containing protein [Pedosphaera parvula]|uniref:LamG-like jellyroll fold domain-containing protein n=1 Tax=Pedosphaera parvula TaxID=1032527 RepID=UPI00135F12BA|nr:LamG-like jellyroll fold domain-containing protein [Pedosphaera parvula]
MRRRWCSCPIPASYYFTNSTYTANSQGNLVIVEGLAAIIAAGLQTTNYDTVHLLAPDPLSYGGAFAAIGGNFAWFNGVMPTNVIVHETGHNYGLGHANSMQDFTSSWLLSPKRSNGSWVGSAEYADIYDMMGGSGPHAPFPNSHFHARAKYMLNWIPPGQVVDATTNGVYRIYCFDHLETRALGKPMALRLTANGVEIFGGFRERYASAPDTSGLCLVTGDDLSRGGPSQYLIDTVPLPVVSNNVVVKDLEDSPLGVGQWWEDPSGTFRLHTVALGGTGANAYVDVQVEKLDSNPLQLFTDATLRTNGLMGSYVSRNLMATNQLDWRGNQTISGRRVDKTLDFGTPDWGNSASVGITGGNATNWDNFSVQWDGVLVVNQTVDVVLRSDDCSQMWIDLNHDGVFATSGPEFINNNWGIGQSATDSAATTLKPGTYAIRIQYVEGGGDNVLRLLTTVEPFSVYADANLTTNGLVGSYVNTSLRSVSAQTDWRTSQTIAGTRIDAYPGFFDSGWGDRTTLHLTGGTTNTDWENFSVQWDGWIQVTTPMTFASRSDDGSRFWIDLNKDGSFGSAAPELVTNHWGVPMSGEIWSGMTPVVNPGNYRIRIQYEEGSGGNTFVLAGQKAWTSPSCAGGQTLIVDTTASEGPGSLSEAINTLNQCGSGTIQITAAGTIHCPPSFNPAIQGQITIQGPGAGLLQLSGTNALGVSSNLFTVATNGSLMLSGMTLADANGIFNSAGTINMTNCTLANFGPSSSGVGAAIYVTGTLRLTNCVFGALKASATNGMFEVPPGQTLVLTGCGTLGLTNGFLCNFGTTVLNGFTAHDGGAVRVGEGSMIYNAGSLVVTNSLFTNAFATGGAIEVAASGTLTVANSTFSGVKGGAICNRGLTIVNGTLLTNCVSGIMRTGGAIYNAGSLRVTNCVFSGNIAAGGNGGGVTSGNWGGGGGGGGGFGGAIHNEAGVTVAQGCTFLNNQARGGDGGHGGVVASYTIPYPGGTGGSPQGGVAPTGNFDLPATPGIVTGAGGSGEGSWTMGFPVGGAGAFGGGGGGGGGRNYPASYPFSDGGAGGTFAGNGHGNDGSYPGGGGGGAGGGGAICVLTGSARVTSCTFYGNSATNGMGGGGGGGDGQPGQGLGGAIFNVGGQLAMTGNTFAGNRAATLGDTVYELVQHSPVSSGLVAYWDFNTPGANTNVNDVFLTFSGTLRNSSSNAWVSGVLSNALSFNGTNAYVYVPTSPLSTNGTLSGAAWAWADSRGAWATIMKNWGSTLAGQFHFGLEDPTGRLNLYIQQQDGTQVGLSEPAQFPTNSWQHVAFVADGTMLRLYRNGVQVAATNYDGTLRTPSPVTLLTMGAKLNDAGTAPDPSSFWRGRLDEMAIWTRPLGSNEVMNLYQAAGSKLGTMAYANLLAVTLPPTITNTSSAVVSGMINPGGLNSLAWFEWESISPYAGYATPPVLVSGTNNVNITNVLNGLQVGGRYGYHIVVSNAFGVAVGTNFSLPFGAPVVVTLPPSQVTYDTAVWHGTVDSGVLPAKGWFEWYVNGVGTTSAPVVIPAYSDTMPLDLSVSNLIIGGTYQVRFCASNSLDVAYGQYYGTNLYSAGSYPAFSDKLVAYWPFDETNGFVLHDASGSTNDATIITTRPNPTWTPGILGGGLELDGTECAIVTNYPKATTALTFSGWVWAEYPPTWATIVKNWGDNQAGQFHLGMLEGQGYVSLYSGDSPTYVRDPVMPMGSWQHFAFIIETNLIALYHNGVLKDRHLLDVNTLLNNNIQSLGIGAKPSDDPGSISQLTPGYWSGKFDDFALWNRALTDDEIALIYRSGSFGYSLKSLMAAPHITVMRSGSNLNLGWPAGLVGYHLEQSPTVNGPNWTAVSGVTTNGYTVPAAGSAMFYRLHGP